ncbi:hypothetical protein JKF63_07398 [Porcisia hertigi]|uniref:Uncharacterized protein n=1 Tax=Porcisia hertigi TaxID=2761500 RepID=A0A836LKU2_9TRYP|nr:hypothetical protein JKF63_07398 [Porcisia hertigi]
MRVMGTSNNGMMTSQPGPLGRGPVTSPYSHPPFTSIQGKKVMMPPGMRLSLGSSGTNPAIGATATVAPPPHAVAPGKKVMMVPPGLGGAASGQLHPSIPSVPPVASVGGGTRDRLPSPQPAKAAAAVTSIPGKKHHKSSIFRRGLNSVVNLLNQGLHAGEEKKDKKGKELVIHEAAVGSGPTGYNKALTPNSRSPAPLPAGQPQPAPLRGRSPTMPGFARQEYVKSGDTAATAGAPMGVQPYPNTAMKNPPSRSSSVGGGTKMFAGAPHPASSRSSSVATISRPGASLASPTQRSSPVPSQQHTQPIPTASLPSPAPAATMNALLVPSSTMLKEAPLPEAGVRPPGHRCRRLGESSEDSDSTLGSDGAQINTATHDAAQHTEESTLPPEPPSPSLSHHVEARDSRVEGYDNDTHNSAGAEISRIPAACPPVRQTAKTAARSTAAVVSRQEEGGEGGQRRPGEVRKKELQSRKLRSAPSTSPPRTQETSPLRPTREAHPVEEPPSPKDDDDTQKPSSVGQNSHSTTSPLSRRASPSPSPHDSTASASAELKTPGLPICSRDNRGGGALPRTRGATPTQLQKRTDKTHHRNSLNVQQNGQAHPRRLQSKIRSRSENARHGGGSEDGSSDGEDTSAHGLRDLTTRDLYRLANLLRDTNANISGASDDHWQRRSSKQRSYHHGNGARDGNAATDSEDSDSWGRQRRQQSNRRSRSTLPVTTIGIPWRYTGTRHSSNVFASPPRVRRPLGYINVGGGCYARVGGSPYTRPRSRPRATSVEVVPLDTTNAYAPFRDAGANGWSPPVSGAWSPKISPLVDDGRHPSVTDLHAKAVLDSQRRTSSMRSGGDKVVTLYHGSQQRQLPGKHGSPIRRHTGGGGSAAGISLDDTVSSAADSQHPYCVSTSVMPPLSQSISPLRHHPTAVHEQCEQQRGESSSQPGFLLRQALGQPYNVSQQRLVLTSAPVGSELAVSLSPREDKTNPVVGRLQHAASQRSNLRGPSTTTPVSAVAARTAAAAEASSRSLVGNPGTLSASVADSEKVEVKGTAAPARTGSQSAGSRLRRTPSPSAQRQTEGYTQRSSNHTVHADPGAHWTPSRKRETVCLSKDTIKRLSTPQQRRGGASTNGALAVSPILRRSHSGVDGNNSGRTVQTCSKWLDEILSSTIVKSAGVRVGSGAEEAAATLNAIPVVDLRREFKPRITGSGGGPSCPRAVSPSLRDSEVRDYTHGFTGSRARPHVPGISFKNMIGARSATGSPPRKRATGASAATVKTVKGISEGLPFQAYSSIHIHDPTRKSPWALAPEREVFKLVPGKATLSRRRRIPVAGNASSEKDASDTQLCESDPVPRTVVEEVHLDEHSRPYLVLRPLPTSEEMEAQRATVERLSKPKPIYRRPDDPA